MKKSPSRGRIQLDAALRRRVESCARFIGVTPDRLVQAAVEQYLSARGSNGRRNPRRRRRLAELANAVSADVPKREWAKLPADLAKNFEHYCYGYPRED